MPSFSASVLGSEAEYKGDNVIKPTRISEQLLFSTIRIEAIRQDGVQAVGTAFFFSFKFPDGQELPVVISNKHVIREATSGRFRVHEATTINGQIVPSGKSFQVTIENFDKAWVFHPDPEIDLCAMFAKPLFDAASAQGKMIFCRQLGSDRIPNQVQLEDLSAVENVVMVGYPTGLWDNANNLPIFRRGITATHPAIDFRGKPMAVVDIACFHGSSGSPVVLMDEGPYLDKTGGTIVGAPRFFLLGVLYSGPRYAVNGEVTISEIPTAQSATVQMPLMIHLGFIVKAREILVLGESLKTAMRI